MGDTITFYSNASRECDVLSKYFELNKTFGVKAMNVFDFMFELCLKRFKPTFELKTEKHAELVKFVQELKTTELQPCETLSVFRQIGKHLDISFKELVSSVEKIDDLMFWSPVKALEKMFEDFYQNGYGEMYMEEYFKDQSKVEKIIKAGKQDLEKEFSELDPCLISFLVNDNYKQHKIITIANKDLTEKLIKTPIKFWLDVIIEEGIEIKVKGIDTEFKNYVVNLSKLTKFWDVYKSQKVDSRFIGNKPLVGGDSVSDNDLFNIYAGNYSLVPSSYGYGNPSVTESNKLICDWDNFNKLSPKQQQATRAFLLSNNNRINNYIQRGAEKVYSVLNKTRNLKNYNQILSSYVKSKSFYGENNTSHIVNLQQAINTRMNNYNFKTVADAMEFIVHQYVPLLQNYKKSNTYNRMINNLLLNSTPLSVIGVAEYLPEQKSEVKIVEKYVEKPGEVKIVEKYIEKPVYENKSSYDDRERYYAIARALSGGITSSEHDYKNTSTDEYIKALSDFQKNFNKVYMSNWRDILSKLKSINENSIRNAGSVDSKILTRFERVMVNSSKTPYCLSGIYKAKNFNSEYTKVVGALIVNITESKNQLLLQFVEPLKNIYDLCKECKSKLRDIKDKYLQSSRSSSDYIYANLSSIKIESDITENEVIELKDACNRILAICNETRMTGINGNRQSSEEMLRKYLSTRKDKNAIIDDYFNNIESELKQFIGLVNSLSNYDQKVIQEMQDLVSMRILINKQTQKCYKWLNNSLDTMLVHNRLYQLKTTTLSIDLLQKIERAYTEFNNYSKEHEIDKLISKLEKASTQASKFRSYFKICKLAKKWIENVDLIGYIERLYKELGISAPDFNWGVFKDNLIVFLVNDMIRVDVFVPTQIGDNVDIYDIKFNLLNVIKHDLDGGKADEFCDGNNLISINGNEEYKIKAEECNTDFSMFLCKKRLQLLNWTTDVMHSDEYIGADLNIERTYTEVPSSTILRTGSSNDNKRLFIYGYSIRNSISNYYPLLKSLPIATFKSILTPIIEVIDKYMIQRYTGDAKFKSTNVALMLKGGKSESSDKVKGSSMFDILEPHEVEEAEVITEAIEFYISGYHILKFYTTLVNNLGNQVNVKFFKISTLYKLKAIFGSSMEITSEEDLKTMIHVFNDIWNSFTENNDKIKTKKAIDILISEINSCIIFNVTDEIGLFRDTLENMDSFDMFSFSFDKLYDVLTKSIKNVSDAIGSLTPTSISTVERVISDSKAKIEKMPQNMRLGALKQMFIKTKSGVDDDYYNFCELCITPLALTFAYYIIAFDVILGKDFNKNEINDTYGIYNKKEFSVNNETQLLVIAPEVYINNKELLDNEENYTAFFKKIVDHVYTQYAKDVDQCIHNIMSYPGYNDEKLSEIKTKIHDAFKRKYENKLTEIKNSKNMDEVSKACLAFKVPTNYIPIANDNSVFKIFQQDFNDGKYGYKTALIRSSSIDTYTNNPDVSYTNFVVTMIAKQHPEYFLPQTFVQLLDNSHLNGVTFTNINGLGIVKVSTGNPNKEIYEIFGSTPLTNMIMYRSRSELAISKTTTNMINSYYANSLISIIPFIISVMHRSSSMLPNKFIYDPTYKFDTTKGRLKNRVDAKIEILTLTQILIKLYNEILMNSSNPQYKDSMDLKIPHSLTELLSDYQDDTISINEPQPFSKYEWINSRINTDIGITYENYDRFELYKNKYIRPLADKYFEDQFETMLNVLSRLTFNKLILSIKFKNTTNLEPQNENISNLIEPLLGGNSDYAKQIRLIAENKKVLELVQPFGLETKALTDIFNYLYNLEISIDLLNEIPISLHKEKDDLLEACVKLGEDNKTATDLLDKLTSNLNIDNKLKLIPNFKELVYTKLQFSGNFESIDYQSSEHIYGENNTSNPIYFMSVMNLIYNVFRYIKSINTQIENLDLPENKNKIILPNVGTWDGGYSIWSEEMIKLLLECIKTNGLGYYLFISTLTCVISLQKGSSNIFDEDDKKIINLEGCAVGVIKILSMCLFEKPVITNLCDGKIDSKDIQSLYNAKITNSERTDKEIIDKLPEFIEGYHELFIDTIVNSYNTYVAGINKRQLWHDGPKTAKSIISDLKIPSLENLPLEIGGSEEKITEKIYDSMIARKFMLGLNMMVLKSDDGTTDINDIHDGSKFSAYEVIKDKIVNGILYEIQSDKNRSGFIAKYSLKEEIKENDALKDILILDKEKNKTNGKLGFDKDCLLTVTIEKKVEEFDESKYFDIALNSSIKFFDNKTTKTDIGPKLNTELTLYYCGLLYGKFKNEIEEGKYQQLNEYINVLSKCNVNGKTFKDFDSIFTNKTFAGKKFDLTDFYKYVGFVDKSSYLIIPKIMENCDTMAKHCCISATKILGSYRSLTKLTPSQNDEVAIYATQFSIPDSKKVNHTYTCFINGRPMHFKFDLGKIENNTTYDDNVKKIIFRFLAFLQNNVNAFICSYKKSEYEVDIDMTKPENLGKYPLISCNNIIIVKDINSNNPVLISPTATNYLTNDIVSSVIENPKTKLQKLQEEIVQDYNLKNELENKLEKLAIEINKLQQKNIEQPIETNSSNSNETQTNSLATKIDDLLKEHDKVNEQLKNVTLKIEEEEKEEEKLNEEEEKEEEQKDEVKKEEEQKDEVKKEEKGYIYKIDKDYCIPFVEFVDEEMEYVYISKELIASSLKYGISVGKEIKKMFINESGVSQSNSFKIKLQKLFNNVMNYGLSKDGIRECMFNTYICGIPIYTNNYSLLKRQHKLYESGFLNICASENRLANQLGIIKKDVDKYVEKKIITLISNDRLWNNNIITLMTLTSRPKYRSYDTRYIKYRITNCLPKYDFRIFVNNDQEDSKIFFNTGHDLKTVVETILEFKNFDPLMYKICYYDISKDANILKSGYVYINHIISTIFELKYILEHKGGRDMVSLEHLKELCNNITRNSGKISSSRNRFYKLQIKSDSILQINQKVPLSTETRKGLIENIFDLLKDTLNPRTDFTLDVRNDGFVGMSGGNIYGRELMDEITNDLIKQYYIDDNNTPIYKNIAPSSVTHDMDFTNLIVSYYKNQMLTFSPIFDKYLYVEILYNSAILDSFITKMMEEFKNRSQAGQNTKYNYLLNIFRVKEDGSNNVLKKIGNYDLGEVKDIKNFNKQALHTKYFDKISIYQNLELSPSEIGKALSKIVPIIRKDEYSHTIKDQLLPISKEILELDKYNIFIGTLCEFIKGFTYYSIDNKSQRTYSKIQDVDISPIGVQEQI